MTTSGRAASRQVRTASSSAMSSCWRVSGTTCQPDRVKRSVMWRPSRPPAPVISARFLVRGWSEYESVIERKGVWLLPLPRGVHALVILDVLAGAGALDPLRIFLIPAHGLLEAAFEG